MAARGASESPHTGRHPVCAHVVPWRHVHLALREEKICTERWRRWKTFGGRLSGNLKSVRPNRDSVSTRARLHSLRGSYFLDTAHEKIAVL
jgi:hypothetical protein